MGDSISRLSFIDGLLSMHNGNDLLRWPGGACLWVSPAVFDCWVAALCVDALGPALDD